jgi:hypothetical protein
MVKALSVVMVFEIRTEKQSKEFLEFINKCQMKKALVGEGIYHKTIEEFEENRAY